MPKLGSGHANNLMMQEKYLPVHNMIRIYPTGMMLSRTGSENVAMNIIKYVIQI